MSSDIVTLTARYVFPVAGPPLERGLVATDGDRILAIEPHGTRAPDFDCGDAAIVPGFVNAHTHLDLTGARGSIPPTPAFTDWLRSVIRYRSERTGDDIRHDIKRGLSESIHTGTTTLGDIAFGGASWELLHDAPTRSVVFRELVGLSTERALRAWCDSLDWSRDRYSTPTCHIGLSPHAPYSASLSLVHAAANCGYKIAIHIAETKEECDLLTTHSGTFVRFLEELGAWSPSGVAPSFEQLVRRARRASQALLVHANYLPLDLAIPPHFTIVYCPRTHAAFGHPPHPFRDFLARGRRIALGTDSLASNPDLDLLAEARFVHARHTDVTGATLLRMATLSGAEALGFADVTGSLSPGKSADFAIVALPERDAADPHELLFASDLPVLATVFRGQRVLVDNEEPRALPGLPLPIVPVP